jgi:hypothetical protein
MDSDLHTYSRKRLAEQITGGLSFTTKMPCPSWGISAFRCGLAPSSPRSPARPDRRHAPEVAHHVHGRDRGGDVPGAREGVRELSGVLGCRGEERGVPEELRRRLTHCMSAGEWDVVDKN